MTHWLSSNLGDLTYEQSAFLSDFMGALPRRARLLAGPGTGKTTMATLAARGCLLAGHVESVVVVSDQRVSRERWSQVLQQEMKGLPGEGTLTLTPDEFEQRCSSVQIFGAGAPSLVIVEELRRSKQAFYKSLQTHVARNSRNRALLLSQPDLRLDSTSGQFWDTHYFFDKPVLRDSVIQSEIVQFAPSYGVLDTVLLRRVTLDDLHWRKFEILVQELLEAEGYEVQLMQGSKDGGVDVVAVMDRGPLGRFKTLWQAKKTGPGGKVGLRTVRELADTRNEFGASKAFIITSAYLTRDAVKRIQRDQFLLGKVDRGDLEAWIARVLQFRHGPGSGGFE